MIGDPELKVAKLYDMLPADAGDTSEGRTAATNATVRTVFVIGPDKKIKLMLIYPMSTGRNFDEVLRVIDSMQLTAKHKVATPVNWKPGDDVIILPSVTEDEAKQKYPEGWKAPTVHPHRPPTPLDRGKGYAIPITGAAAAKRSRRFHFCTPHLSHSLHERRYRPCRGGRLRGFLAASALGQIPGKTGPPALRYHKPVAGATMKLKLSASFLLFFSTWASAQIKEIPRATLRDKIEGGWAGQMIGVSFGAPTEFRSNAQDHRRATSPSGRPTASPTPSTRTISTST